jgi:hypothetical protein
MIEAVSDQRLREFELRWRASGSSEDEAFLLRERVRVGGLSEARLELAAYLGHSAAVGAAAKVGGAFPDEGLVVDAGHLKLPGASEEWAPTWLVRLLELGEVEAVLRAAVALYRRSELTRPASDVSIWDQDVSVNPCWDSTLAIEAWIVGEGDEEALKEFKRSMGLDAALARLLARCVCPLGEQEITPPQRVPIEVARALPFLGLSTDAASQAIVEELVPWALGYADPVRLRVAKRGEVEIAPGDLEP